MEIINCVQSQPRSRRITLPFFAQRERKYYSSGDYSFYSTELKSFKSKRVRNPVTVHSVFMGIGRALSLCENILVENTKKFVLAAIAAVCVCGITAGSVVFVNYMNNYTGPLKMQKGDTLDIENLNKLMQNFALEGIAEFTEDGKILDTVSIVANYDQPVTYQTYKVRSGDTIGGIAKRFGLSNISTLISVNDISNVRQLAAGQKLKIPSMDGIVYTVKKGDSIDSLCKKNNIKLETLLDVNELISDVLTPGQQLFLPGVALDSKTLKTAMGDRFIMPIQSKFRWSSPYGNRIDPIAGVKSFHTGTDMACPTGTPIVAAMSGKVSTTGVNRVYGNYVIIDHGNGYQTLYAHMSKIIASKGQWVSQGTRIGLVGSTGYSTGPHLHFTVYKNGKMVDPMSVLK